MKDAMATDQTAEFLMRKNTYYKNRRAPCGTRKCIDEFMISSGKHYIEVYTIVFLLHEMNHKIIIASIYY